MAYAYALSPGKEKASALSNVRSGYRECTETLCALEVKIEQLIGTLTLEMKGNVLMRASWSLFFYRDDMVLVVIAVVMGSDLCILLSSFT